MKRLLLLVLLTAVPAWAGDVVTGYYTSGNPKMATGVVMLDASGVVSTRAPTYNAVIPAITPAASATDVTEICGSATKTVQVNSLGATADASAAASLDFYVFYRTASDVGGTSSVVAAQPHDPNTTAVSTASVRSWTANPSSVGTGVLSAADHYALPAATSTGYPISPWFKDWSKNPIVLRGVNQCLAFSLNGQAIPAGTTVYITFEWTEE